MDNFVTLKSLLFFIRDHGGDIDGNDTNLMVYGACTDALAGMSYEEYDIIMENVKRLQDAIKRIGDKGALELLASVAKYIDKE